MELLGLLLIPTAVAIGTWWKFPQTITWKEFLLQAVVPAALMIAGFYIAKYQAMSAEETIHGRITKKVHGDEKCCHCRMVCDRYEEVCTGSGKTKSCSTECTQEHEECDHSEDYYWYLDSTIGRFPIDDCEPNRRRVPSVWANAYVGEPAAKKHSYTNYLLADPENVLVHQVTEKTRPVPEFPDTYGVYKINPVIGKAPPGWQEKFREMNADLGPLRQVDITVMVTNHKDPTYAQDVEARWLYGPKNSLNIILGVQDGTIRWARVVTFSKVEDLKIYLRDELEGMKLTDDVPGLIRKAVMQKFHRTAMADYEYLASAAKPSTGALIFLYILGALASIGLAIAAHKHDIFGDERGGPFRRRTNLYSNYYNRRRFK